MNPTEVFPEVEAFTRVWTYTGNTIFRDNQQMRIKYMLADSSFFTMFSFKLLEGNPTEVFKTKNSAVLSKSLAYKIFGNESPQGESFSINGRT
ncbi:MAG: ABC transporter permease, partial [Bacteroidota bacterium]|nr:ABC transporter permease [Bacteroidota bacterium]